MRVELYFKTIDWTLACVWDQPLPNVGDTITTKKTSGIVTKIEWLVDSSITDVKLTIK